MAASQYCSFSKIIPKGNEVNRSSQFFKHLSPGSYTDPP